MAYGSSWLALPAFCTSQPSPTVAMHASVTMTGAGDRFLKDKGSMSLIHGLGYSVGEGCDQQVAGMISRFLVRPVRSYEMQEDLSRPLSGLCCKPISIFRTRPSGSGPSMWLQRRGLVLVVAAQGPGPASRPGRRGGGTPGDGALESANIGSVSATGRGYHQESAMSLLHRSAMPEGSGTPPGWNREDGRRGSGMGDDAISAGLLQGGATVGDVIDEVGDLGVPDVELEKIAESISTIERRNESFVQEMNEFMRVLADTTKVLSARAQVARIEAAKLKKLERLQSAEEVRRVQELRKTIDLRRVEEKRLEEIRNEQQQRQLALDDALKVANASAAGGVNVEGREYLAISVAPASFNDDLLTSASTTSDVGLLATVPAMGSLLDDDSDGDALGPDVVTLPESFECTITHPGALSCTKTTIRKDASRKRASITMTVTTRCEGDACHSSSLDVDDYVGLGVRTLAEMAQELKQSRFQQAADADPVVHEKHRLIVDILKNGHLVSAKPNEPPSKFGHESFVVELVDPRTNHRIVAMFKPRVEGDADGWHRASVEYVAYELNLMLGMDYVPPVAYRKGGVMLGDRQFEEGAFIYYVPHTKPLKRVSAMNWGVSVARMLSDTRILDVLLNNSDRHHGHFLYGDHWADGKPRPVLIDHAAGFRKEAVVAMDHENAFQTGPVRCVAAKTYLRLRFLEHEMVTSKFSKDISQSEISALMDRRDQILAYLDQLVKERGYHRTVLDE